MTLTCGLFYFWTLFMPRFGMWLHFIVDKVLFWVLICLLALEFYNLLFHKGVPNIRTAPAIRHKIIERIKQDVAQRPMSSYTIMDLGSGDGLLTREIAKAIPQANVIGIEISSLSVFWSRWMKRLRKIQNVSYLKQDFLTYDFSQADAIVVYLLPWYMKQLSDKFDAETRSGTLIFSNKFPLYDGWKAHEETQSVPTLYLHQRDLHIYRKP